MRMKYTSVMLGVLMCLFILNLRDAMPMDLSEFQWKNRLLFLFAPDGDHPLFKNLKSAVRTQKAEVEDRDLIVFEVLEEGSSRMNTAELDRQTADSIRDHFGVPQNNFTLILVGKDGGVKLKRHEAVGLDDIFGLIDSMPMRQNEMRHKNQ